MQRDYPSKHVLVVKNDGEYLSTSDFDEDTLALLEADHVDNEPPEEHIGAEDADRYESLIMQRVLSANEEGGAKSATHVDPNKVCHQIAFLPHDH